MRQTPEIVTDLLNHGIDCLNLDDPITFTPEEFAQLAQWMINLHSDYRSQDLRIKHLERILEAVRAAA